MPRVSRQPHLSRLRGRRPRPSGQTADRGDATVMMMIGISRAGLARPRTKGAAAKLIAMGEREREREREKELAGNELWRTSRFRTWACK